MTHERDQSHALSTSGPATDHDAGLAPGRAARTDTLIGPHGPRPTGLLMRKGSGSGVAADAEQAVGAASSSLGHALPDELKTKFEGSLGTDLSEVRVHTSAVSADATAAVGARAYATGNDIHFGAGEYQPQSAGGQELIAHEVAHTVQQRGGTATRQHKLEVSSSGDHAEVEADRAASAMVSGSAFSLGGASSGLYREEKKSGPLSGGLSRSANGTTKLTVKASIEKPIDVSYVTVTPGGELTVDATLSRKKEEKAGEKPDPANDPEAHREEAQTAGNASFKEELAHVWSDLTQTSHEEEGWEAPEVEGTTKGAAGCSVTCNLKFYGKKIAVKVTALELAKGETPKVGVVEVDVPLTRKSKTLWQNDRFQLDAAATVTAKCSIEPNWKKIWPQLAKQAATKLRPLMSELLASVSGEAVVGAGFFLIGASVLGALAIGAEALADIAAAEKAAKAKLAGFGDGVSSGFGVERRTSEDVEGFQAGAAEAHKAMNAQIAKVQTNPLFVEFGFTAAELEHAMRAAVAPHVPQLTQHAMGQAQHAIFSKAAKAFYDKEMASVFGTYSDAVVLANRLGVPDAIPPRKD